MRPRSCRYKDCTTAPMSLYADIATGNDVSGRGTAALPYATPLRAYQDVPHYVAHPVNIAIAAGVYPVGSFPRSIDTIFVDSGSLNIYGVGAPVRKAVRGGPHTVTGSVALGGGIARRITIGAAAGWVADEFCGYWCRVVTGAHVGQTFPVYGNDATTFAIPEATNTVDVADTIEFISPATQIAVNDLCVAYKKHSVYASAGWALVTQLVLANLWLDASASTAGWGQFLVTTDCDIYDGPLFEFCRLDALDCGIAVVNTKLSVYAGVDASYVAACGAGIANMQAATQGPSFSMVNSSGRADICLRQYGGSIYTGSVTGQIQWYGVAPWFCGGCAAIEDISEKGGSMNGWIAGVSVTVPAVKYAKGDFKIHVEGACQYALYGDDQGVIYLHSANTCSPALCALSAVSLGPMGRLMLHDSCANFLGATAGQKAFICRGDVTVKSDTWPAAHTIVSDGLGGEILRTT